MGRRRHRRLGWLSVASAVAAVTVAGPGLPTAAAAHTSDLKTQFASGQRFIDLLNAPPHPDILPTQADIALRFSGGAVAYQAQDVKVLKDASFQGYYTRIDRIVSRLLAGYTAGPKPSQVPFVIVSSNDVNCVVTPVAPEQYRNHLTEMANLAFSPKPVNLEDAVKARANGAGPTRAQAPSLNFANASNQIGSAQTPFVGNVLPPNVPVAMQMRCSRPFLDQITSDDEIAFVVAHELSHILLGHWKAGDAEIREQMKTEHALQTGIGLISSMQNLSAETGVLQAANSKYYSEAKTKLTAASFMLNEYNIVIRGPSWQREQERDADILALDLLYKAGFTRAGSWQILTKADAAQKELNKKNPYFESLVKSTAAQMVLSVSPDQLSMFSTVRTTALNVGASVYGHVRDSQIQKVHDNAEVRTKAAIEYERQHPTADTSSKAEDDFFGGNSFAKASAPVAKAGDFVASIQEGSCETLTSEQQAQLRSMLASKRRTQSESEALYIYYDCTGSSAKAAVYAGEAANGPSKTSDYYINYILALTKVKQYAKAAQVIAVATRQAPPYDQYVFLDIEVKMKLGQKAQAIKAAEACYVALHLSNPPAGDHCLALAGIDETGKPVAPEAPPPTIETNKGVVAGAASVANYTVVSTKRSAKSLMKGAKNVFGIAKANTSDSADAAADQPAPSEAGPATKPKKSKKKTR